MKYDQILRITEKKILKMSEYFKLFPFKPASPDIGGVEARVLVFTMRRHFFRLSFTSHGAQFCVKEGISMFAGSMQMSMVDANVDVWLCRIF